MRPTLDRASTRFHRKDRGAALLVVIVSTAILTAIAVDLAYSTRVSLLTAANARDELRAEYLARGAVQLSRLVLKFQKELDEKSVAGVPSLQIFDLVPITNALTDGIFAAPGAEGSAPSFEAKIEDEGRKVNAQLDAAFSSGQQGAQVEAFLQLVGDPRWDPLFDREDEYGQRYTRPDIAVNLCNWTDTGSAGFVFTGSFAKPFESGFGDKNQPYYRYEPPYKAKNNRFDSLDELYLVAGIDDAFMEAFGKQLTVYAGKDDKINVNSTDPKDLFRDAYVLALPKDQVAFRNPQFEAELFKNVMLQRAGGAIKLQPKQFAEIVRGMGVTVNEALLSGANSPFTDRSVSFRIRATAAVGMAEKRLDAVAYFPTNTSSLAQQASDLGLLLHWREE